MAMLLTTFSRLARVRVTLLYTVTLVAVAFVLLELGPRVQDQVIRHLSTNLHNLGHGHLGTLVGSAFVIETGPIYVWLPGLIAVMALAELHWRSSRLIVAFAVGHIGATLLVALGLTAALGVGLMSVSITNVTDVGMSYGAVGVLGALTAAIPRRWRPAWTGWWLAVALGAVVLSGFDFTDVGHAIALMLGMLVSLRFGTPGGWTPMRYLLLAVAVAFSYLVLANDELSMMTAFALGALGAVVADRIARRHLVRRSQAAAETAPLPMVSAVAAVSS